MNQPTLPEWKSCFDEANTLEARAYILLADARGAAYVPDRIFGVKALEGYSEVLQQSHHLQDHDQFRRKLAEQLKPDQATKRSRQLSLHFCLRRAATLKPGREYSRP